MHVPRLLAQSPIVSNSGEALSREENDAPLKYQEAHRDDSRDSSPSRPLTASSGESAETITIDTTFEPLLKINGQLSGKTRLSQKPALLEALHSSTSKQDPANQVTEVTLDTNDHVVADPTPSDPQTTSQPEPSIRHPCNNYVEFCDRKYSNVTEICAHNSPFARKGNLASNQEYAVLNQLNDGVRMLQGQTHFVNNTLHFCHTSCDLLNAGTVKSYLATVTDWLIEHPYDVVTILLGNGDSVNVEKFIPAIQHSGIAPYLFEPPRIPMRLDDWPTLSEMIQSQKRVVLFMDYRANQYRVPYILDQFSQLWETPFSPTDPTFPCTVQRPTRLRPFQARKRMYMANHNLNLAVGLGRLKILVPDIFHVGRTNAMEGFSSLGAAVETCIDEWGRPPNFLLVDYYNAGGGSVFKVAAKANNVTYSRPCCGSLLSSAAPTYTGMTLMGIIIICTAFATIMFLHKWASTGTQSRSYRRAAVKVVGLSWDHQRGRTEVYYGNRILRS